MGVSVITVVMLLMMWTDSFGGNPTSGQLQTPSNRPIQLNKCCATSEEYIIGFDMCGEMQEDAVLQELKPRFYSSRDVTVLSRKFEANGFDLISNQLESCTDTGFVANFSIDFRLLDDGSLFIQSSRTIIQERKFCIEQYSTLIEENPTALVARFCVPDPCSGRNCIRKCCSVGMVLNETANLCQIATENLGFSFHNESGVSIPSSSVQTLAIHDSAALICPAGMLKFIPDDGECFSLLPNGSLFIPFFEDEQKYTNQYCVDHQLSDDGTQKVMGIICLPPSEDHSWVYQLYPPLLILSSIFLIATLIVYAIISEFRNIHGISIMCFVASLAVMYIGLGAIQTNLDIPNWLCIGLAIVTHYSFLCSFTWLSVMSFDIWRASSDLGPTLTPGRAGKMHTGRRLMFYFIYAWAVPFIIVITGLILDKSVDETIIEEKEQCWFENEEERQNYMSLLLSRPKKIIRPHFGEGICWFPSVGMPIVAYLYGPIGFLIFVNLVFLILTSATLHRARVDPALAPRKHEAKLKFRVVLYVSILMGLTWISKIASYGVGGDPIFWVVTDVINILINGVAVFIMFACKPAVWGRLQSKIIFLKRLDGLCPNCTKERAQPVHISETHQETTGINLYAVTSTNYHAELPAEVQNMN